MDKFVKFDGLVAPLDRANVDTDAIIPKQFLKSIKRSGFGPNAFDEWRYMDQGEPGQDCAVCGRAVAQPAAQFRGHGRWSLTSTVWVGGDLCAPPPFGKFSIRA